jgi:hypothetical protein
MNVAYWHIADIPECLLMTQIGRQSLALNDLHLNSYPTPSSVLV